MAQPSEWTAVTKFDRVRVAEALTGLSENHRVAFAASCCERLLPNYRAFVHQEGWGRPDVLREGLTVVWRQLAGERLPEAYIRQLACQCEEAAPHTEDFSSLFVSPAL